MGLCALRSSPFAKFESWLQRAIFADQQEATEQTTLTPGGAGVGSALLRPDWNRRDGLHHALEQGVQIFHRHG